MYYKSEGYLVYGDTCTITVDTLATLARRGFAEYWYVRLTVTGKKILGPKHLVSAYTGFTVYKATLTLLIFIGKEKVRPSTRIMLFLCREFYALSDV